VRGGQEKLPQSALNPAGSAALEQGSSGAFSCANPFELVSQLTVRGEYLDISAGKIAGSLARRTFAGIESECDVRVHKPPI
jgi:hypothetical protein